MSEATGTRIKEAVEILKRARALLEKDVMNANQAQAKLCVPGAIYMAGGTSPALGEAFELFAKGNGIAPGGVALAVWTDAAYRRKTFISGAFDKGIAAGK